MSHKEDYRFFRVMADVRKELQTRVRVYAKNEDFMAEWFLVTGLLEGLADAYMDDMGQSMTKARESIETVSTNV